MEFRAIVHQAGRGAFVQRPVIRARAALTAYGNGVNAFLGSNALPPEYPALELTHTEPWTALDSTAVA